MEIFVELYLVKRYSLFGVSSLRSVRHRRDSTAKIFRVQQIISRVLEYEIRWLSTLRLFLAQLRQYKRASKHFSSPHSFIPPLRFSTSLLGVPRTTRIFLENSPNSSRILTLRHSVVLFVLFFVFFFPSSPCDIPGQPGYFF